MRTLIVALALAVVFAAPVAADDLGELLAPDAGLYAQTIGTHSRGVEGIAKELGSPKWLGERRVWGDVLKPFNSPGLGLSIDAHPGGPACAGVGYQRGWLGYIGVHAAISW